MLTTAAKVDGKKTRPDYSRKTIRWLLDNYSLLAAGKMPAQESGYEDYGIRIQTTPGQRAPFEKPAQLKADIDKAMQQALTLSEKFVLVSLHVTGWRADNVAFIMEKTNSEILHTENRAINKLRKYLNT